MRLDLQESLPHTPRRAQLRDAGWRTIASGMLISSLTHFSSQYRYSIGENRNKKSALTPVVEPFHALEQAFSPHVADCTVLQRLAPYFERVAVPVGHVLWKHGDPADGLYVIEAGVLRATYYFATHTPAIEESMVPGTLAGELSGLAGLPRNATVVVERAAVLWYLSGEALGRLQAEYPELARIFTALVLKGACCRVFLDERKVLIVITCDWCGLAAKLDFDTLLSALATRQ
jgi:SulP family sulfate permease